MLEANHSQVALSHCRPDRNGCLVESYVMSYDHQSIGRQVTFHEVRRHGQKSQARVRKKAIHMPPQAPTLAAGERPGKPGAEKQARPKADLQSIFS